METEDILETLEPLFEQAEKEGLWFYCPYQDLWFTPKELREKQANGRFIWGLPNWELKNPQKKIDSLEQYKVNIGANINEQIKDFKKRMQSEFAEINGTVRQVPICDKCSGSTGEMVAPTNGNNNG